MNHLASDWMQDGKQRTFCHCRPDIVIVSLEHLVLVVRETHAVLCLLLETQGKARSQLSILSSYLIDSSGVRWCWATSETFHTKVSPLENKAIHSEERERDVRNGHQSQQSGGQSSGGCLLPVLHMQT